MKVSQLIAKLQKLPQDAEVYTSNNEGCEECNPEGMPYYHEVLPPEHRETGEYPYHDLKNIVVL